MWCAKFCGRATVRAVLALTWSLAVLGTPGVAAANAGPPLTEVPAESAGAITNYGLGITWPADVTPGPDGNLWFVGFLSGTIGRLSPAGLPTVFAGPGIVRPSSITGGPDGNLWFTNSGSSSIGRITTGGAVTVFNGASLGVQAPTAITNGPDGNLWFTHANGLGRITAAGTITTFPIPGLSPTSITVGPDANLWFGAAAKVGKITPAGTATVFSDPTIKSTKDIATGPDGNLWFTNFEGQSIGRVTPAGVVSAFTDAGIDYPWGIVAAPDGALWFTNEGNKGAPSLGRITTTGAITYVTHPTLARPEGLTVGPDGNLWFANFGNGSIGRSTTTGVVTTFTGTGVSLPKGITTGPDGNLWFTNSASNSIGRITPGGVIANFTSPSIRSPQDIESGADGALWFVNLGNNSIGRITVDGSVTNHPVAALTLQMIAAGPDGNMWFTSFLSNRIGRITPAGVVTLFADPGIAGPTGITGGPDGNLWFTNASSGLVGRITTAGVVTIFSDPGLSSPRMITNGPDGNVWFTNSGTHSIGRITPAGVVTIFGLPASLRSPLAITAGADGNLWFTNFESAAFGRITPSGTVTSFPAPLVNGSFGITAGPNENMWFTSMHNSWVGELATGLPAQVTGVHASAGMGAGMVMWDPPTVGYAAVGAFTATANPGGATCDAIPPSTSCTVTGLAPGTSYSFTVRATNTSGSSTISPPSNSVTPTSGARFHPMTPKRILDSRTALGGWASSPLIAGSPRSLTVTGGSGATVPASASAAVLNLTVTNSSLPSFLTTYPAAGTIPATSTVNFGAGQTIANLATVKVGAAGQVSFANAAGTVDVVADLVGYYDDGTPGSGDLFTATTPVRAVDSRTSPAPWNAKLTNFGRDLLVRPAVVPATATAVVANITVTNATQPSFVTVWPSGSPKPSASTLNFGAGQTIANLATIKIGTGGNIRFANAAGATDVIVDIVGYFDPTAGHRFYPTAPVRILDDRVGVGLSGPWAPGQTRTLAVTGSSGIPANAVGLAMNLTGTNASTGTFLTVFPAGMPKPTASNLNVGPAQTIANVSISGIGGGGAIAIANELGTIDVIADTAGYFAPA